MEPQLIDGRGYGLFFRGHRLNLTRDQFQHVMRDLEIEVSHVRGRRILRAIPKKKPRADLHSARGQ